jgi:hypothetical protein
MLDSSVWRPRAELPRSNPVIWFALTLSFVIFAAVVTFVALSSMGKLDGVMGAGRPQEYRPQQPDARESSPEQFSQPQFSSSQFSAPQLSQPQLSQPQFSPRPPAPTARHASRSRH